MTKKQKRKSNDSSSSSGSSSSSSSEDESNFTLKINEKYAARFQHNKEREELEKLRAKYENDSKKAPNKAKRNDNSSDSSSSDEEEEESSGLEDEVFDSNLDLQIVSTLNAIRTKDPKIYDDSFTFFSSSNDNSATTLSKKHEKPLFIKDFHRQTLLEGGIPGIAEDSLPNTDKPKLTHVEEMLTLKDEFKKAAASIETEASLETRASIEAEEPEEEIFTKKAKSTHEIEQEESDYKKWLLSKADSFTQEEDKRLFDFVFSNPAQNPTTANNSIAEELSDLVEELSDLEEYEKQEAYEQKFNFRFEEIEKEFGGGGAQYNPEIIQSRLYGIKTHRRDLDSVRRKDDSRSKKRKEREERKLNEKKEKMSELNRLKNLKKKEIQEFANKIKSISSVDADNVENQLSDILEKDFDPDSYDKLMTDMFDDDFYALKEKQRPDLSDESEFEGEAPVLKIASANATDSTAAAATDASPDTEKLKNLLSEYDQLNYEDVIDGQPTRFRYKPVDPTTFGLEYKEILEAEDGLLNEFISLKKLAPYKNGERHSEWMSKWQKSGKKKRREFRKKLSLPDEQEQEHKNVSKKSKFNSLSDRKAAYGL